MASADARACGDPKEIYLNLNTHNKLNYQLCLRKLNWICWFGVLNLLSKGPEKVDQEGGKVRDVKCRRY